jgi:hypothetical protein
MRKPAEGESAAGLRSGQTARWRPERGSWDASGLNAEPTGSGVAPMAGEDMRRPNARQSARGDGIPLGLVGFQERHEREQQHDRQQCAEDRQQGWDYSPVNGHFAGPTCR